MGTPGKKQGAGSHSLRHEALLHLKQRPRRHEVRAPPHVEVDVTPLDFFEQLLHTDVVAVAGRPGQLTREKLI